MRKALCTVLDLLALCCLAGAPVVSYFTGARLGMRRWVNYHTYQFEDILPLDLLKWVAVIAVAIAAAAVCAAAWKRRGRLAKLQAVPLAAMLLLVALYFAFTATNTLATCPAYYIMLPLLGLAALFLMLRNAIYVAAAGGEPRQ